MNISKFQLSFFGAYSHIKPTSEILIKLTDAYKEQAFIPSTLELLEFDVGLGKFTNNKRIRMISEDSAWEMPINPNRIDFICIKPEENTLEDVVDYALKLADIIFNKLDINVERMAFNVYLNIRYLPEEDTSDIYDNFVKILPSSEIETLKSWTAKYNSTSLMEINTKDELINNIINISYLKNHDESKIISVALDINTDATNKTNRFDYKTAKVFSEYAIEKSNAICSDINTVLEYEDEK